jgi:hypothetical protein
MTRKIIKEDISREKVENLHKVRQRSIAFNEFKQDIITKLGKGFSEDNGKSETGYDLFTLIEKAIAEGEETFWYYSGNVEEKANTELTWLKTASCLKDFIDSTSYIKAKPLYQIHLKFK